MTMETTSLIPPSLLFRFQVPCRHISKKWNTDRGVKLAPEFQLPVLSEIDALNRFADVRAAWNKDGLIFEVKVEGKRQGAWCRPTQLTESDGFQVWIDTRDTHNVHRANRFCHWFVFLPTGGGAKRDEPIATMLKINRSKEDPKTMNQIAPRIVSQIRSGGYWLAIQIPSSALTGWNPDEHCTLGFNYMVIDRELGCQPLSIGPAFPVAEDPSLWQSLELQD